MSRKRGRIALLCKGFTDAFKDTFHQINVVVVIVDLFLKMLVLWLSQGSWHGRWVDIQKEKRLFI